MASKAELDLMVPHRLDLSVEAMEERMAGVSPHIVMYFAKGKGIPDFLKSLWLPLDLPVVKEVYGHYQAGNISVSVEVTEYNMPRRSDSSIERAWNTLYKFAGWLPPFMLISEVIYHRTPISKQFSRREFNGELKVSGGPSYNIGFERAYSIRFGDARTFFKYLTRSHI